MTLAELSSVDTWQWIAIAVLGVFALLAAAGHGIGRNR